MSTHLAIDLGAESGRVVLGRIADGRITHEELHRFSTQPLFLQGHWRWNVYRFLEEILAGCRKAVDASPVSIGVDSWGVDYALIATDESLIGLPVAYRDDRTEGMMERFFERMPKDTIYAKTGAQFMRLNSLYQLFAVAQNDPRQWEAAAGILFMPDIFHYLLSGERATEFTFATTTQLYNVFTQAWDGEICDALGLERGKLNSIHPTGDCLAPMQAAVAEQTGLTGVDVVLPASHDTASAVAAIPAEGDDWAFISSGTWSLVGAEIREPVCTTEALRYNFSNEGGVGGTYRFLKNVMGLWIVQGLRNDFLEAGDYARLIALANDAPAFQAFINPDAEDFYHPDSMAGAVRTYLERTGQVQVETAGAFVRCALESLALRYRQVLDQLHEVTGKGIRKIHVVGGGSRNALLCQWTSNATSLPVYAGPAESTALGNIISQAVGTAHLGSFAEGRVLVRDSSEVAEYAPRDTGRWGEAYDRFLRMHQESADLSL